MCAAVTSLTVVTSLLPDPVALDAFTRDQARVDDFDFPRSSAFPHLHIFEIVR